VPDALFQPALGAVLSPDLPADTDLDDRAANASDSANKVQIAEEGTCD
jgi:hypothetical protein